MNKHIKSLWLLPLAGLSLSLMPSCTTDSYGNSTVTPLSLIHISEPTRRS